jgi:HemY protein
VSDRWAPLSPITGKLDAFRWEVPPEALAPPTRALDDVLADLDDKPAVPAPLIAAAAEPIEAASAAAEAREVIEATTPEPATADVAPPAPAEATRPAEPVRIADATGPAEPARPGEAAALQAAETAERAEPAPVIETQPPPAKPNGSGAPYGEPAPVVFPVPHAPDDPGADEAETKRSRFRILG